MIPRLFPTLPIAVLSATLCFADAEPLWDVHDPERPRPPRVEPLPAGELPSLPPPPGAIVLFDGDSLHHWRPSEWKVKDGILEITPRSGNLVTLESFGSCHLHLEWIVAEPVQGHGQGRGNSGVFLMGRYEVQILDNVDNETYADGMAGALYGQHPPRVDPARPPGEWNRYEIIFRAPRFGPEGDLLRPAKITVLFNGHVVHNNVAFEGLTTHGRRATYRPHPDAAPLMLQDHRDRVQFRNIWIVPLED
ncbi:MAG: DUF1080 domain-containing protein [Puniceicoccaceae bacterium]|nr:MAG: DUF1080 domain-containing protein [Puniceicoccaceae bacterium]